MLGEPVKSLGLKILLWGAEPGAGIPEVLQRLEGEYGAKLFDMGAGYGCSCDHPVDQGMHRDEEVRQEDLTGLERGILAKMHGEVKIRPAITWLKPYTLERSTKKTQFLEKKY